MNELRPTAGRKAWLGPQMRTQVTTAALALLVREMKDVGTPDTVAMKVLHEAPDKIDAALTRGRRALVFFQVDASSARGIVSDDGAKLDTFARAAHAAGARVLCFNPTLIAGLAAVVEPNIDALIEATSPGVGITSCRSRSSARPPSLIRDLILRRTGRRAAPFLRSGSTSRCLTGGGSWWRVRRRCRRFWGWSRA